MLPYGQKKRKQKPHAHDECGVCCSHPPLNSKSGRQQGKKEIQKELDIMNDTSASNFPCTVSEELDMKGVVSSD